MMKIQSKFSLLMVALVGVTLSGTGLANPDSGYSKPGFGHGKPDFERGKPDFERGKPDLERGKPGSGLFIRTERPLSDFLEKQGSRSDFFAIPELDIFPPDQLGHAPSEEIIFGQRKGLFALVDYSGVIADYIKDEIGREVPTQTTGSVTQIERPDGQAHIIVDLKTENALMFAQHISDLIVVDEDDEIVGFEFATTKPVFGATPLCIIEPLAKGCDDAFPVTGSSRLYLTFTMPKPGKALPDLVELVGNYSETGLPSSTYAPFALHFEAEAKDEKGRVLYIYQTVSSSEECVTMPEQASECKLEFQLEVVEIE